MHPYYQNFIFDDARMFVLYEEITRYKLILICHTGFDIAFPLNRICDPARILNVVNNFPEMKFVAAHFGAWQDWDEVEKKLIGKNIYLETSFSLETIGEKKAKELILKHPSGYLLFGTDSPWTDQKSSVKFVRSLNLDNGLTESIFYKNALRLLELN
jgi:hypothetical protein